jgi:hypothetical protein
MVKNYKLFLVLLLVSINLTAAVLKDGTDIPVRLAENVNGNINFTGETIYFQVTEDIKADGVIVIKAGTFVKGMVHEAVGRKSLGKGGKLTLMPRSLKTEDGEIIKFEKFPLSQEGRKRTGATVAHVVMWGPLGLFAKGRAAFMFKGTEFDITVNGDYDLPGVKPKGGSKHTYEDFNVTFKEYNSKINYRKGKIGKDFTVIVANSSDFDANDLIITEVDDYILPKPIKPIAIARDRKNNQLVNATFSFKDIIKYALPETSNFVFQIGDTYKGRAQLNTRWKLK